MWKEWGLARELSSGDGTALVHTDNSATSSAPLEGAEPKSHLLPEDCQAGRVLGAGAGPW